MSEDRVYFVGLLVSVAILTLAGRLILKKYFFKKGLTSEQLWLEGRTLGAIISPRRYFRRNRIKIGMTVYLINLLLIIVIFSLFLKKVLG